MYAKRRGKYIICTAHEGKRQLDEDFLAELRATKNEIDNTYRLPYSDTILDKITAYMDAMGYGVLDTTLSAFAVKRRTWRDFEPLNPPSKRVALDYQARCMQFLYEDKRGGLFVDMGLGKSKIAVDLTNYLCQQGLAENCLVVTDSSVMYTWADYHVPIDCDVKAITLDGTRSDRVTKLQYGLRKGYRFFVINWPGFHVIQKELTAWLGQGTVFVHDESQRAKNVSTRTFRHCWKFHKTLNNTYVWLLSGTPITQSPEDAFGQFAFIESSIFGDPLRGLAGFRATYVRQARHNRRQVVGYKNMDLFCTKVAAHSVRVKTSDVIDLPPQNYEPILLDLPPKLAAVYREYSQTKGVLHIEGHPADNGKYILLSEHPFSVLAKGLQIVNNFVYTDTAEEQVQDEITAGRPSVKLIEELESPKIEWLLQLLSDTSEDVSVVVWFHHHAIRSLIERALIENDHSYVIVDRTVKIKKRSELFNRFQEGRVRVLVAQLTTCRTGNDFTRAYINVYVQNTYSVETRLQSEKRTHRLGMQLDVAGVLYYDLIYRNTIEAKQYQRLRDGMDFSAAVTDGVEIREILDGEWRIR